MTKNPEPEYFMGEAATERRHRQLQTLFEEGLNIVFETRWKATVGPLVIWLHSGRWVNEATGRRGKLNSLSMRELIIQCG